ncbi:hypothetical protein TNCV_2605491 [Trichonephila clavipes]|nr:hypothetical protein TNCV_2605491 [Trichonephila clavipes]
MWAVKDMNEKECRPVMLKAYPQCQSDSVVYSLPDGKLHKASELVSDTPANGVGLKVVGYTLNYEDD